MERRVYIGTVPKLVFIIDKIYSIHYFEYVKSFSGIGEAHDFWEMVYVDYGNVIITASNDSFLLNQGQAYFHEPNEYHNVEAADEFSSMFIISFYTKSPDADLLRGRKIVLQRDDRQLVSSILKESEQVFAGALDVMHQTQLVRHNKAPFGGEQIIKILAEHLIINLLRRCKAEEPLEPAAPVLRKPREKNEEYIVDEIINILSQNLYNNLSLDSIGHEIMYSKSYIEKIFKEKIGCGIIRYFNTLKIKEAKRIISEGQYNFSKIAEMLNFGSLHYFSRTFKAVTGMSPSGYAKSVRSTGLL